jgi:hypothetical protein
VLAEIEDRRILTVGVEVLYSSGIQAIARAIPQDLLRIAPNTPRAMLTRPNTKEPFA